MPETGSKPRFFWVLGIFLLTILAFYAPFFLHSERDGPEQVFRLGTNVWPGYEPFYLARKNGFFQSKNLRLIEMTNTTDVLRAFRNDALEAAALTLDEALSLAQWFSEFSIILVLDVSHGGDALLASKEIPDLQGLRGKKIGAETTAVGGLVLARALEKAGMKREEISIIPLEVSKHEQAFLSGSVDGIVTFEPTVTKLMNRGAHKLFDSSQIPGEIIDVLVVRNDALKKNPGMTKRLINGWFQGLDSLKSQTPDSLKKMQGRLEMSPEDIKASLEGLQFPDREENLRMLSTGSIVATRLASLEKFMRNEGLVASGTNPDAVSKIRITPEYAR